MEGHTVAHLLGDLDSVSVRGVDVLGVGVGMDNGNVDDMGNKGVGSMGVGGVDDVGVDGLVCARVTSKLP